MAKPIEPTILSNTEFKRIVKELENPVYDPKVAQMFKEADRLCERISCPKI